MEQRHAESQALLLDESRAASEQGSSVHHAEPTRRSGGVQQEAAAFNLNLSFEELSGAGLEEPPRYCNNSQWPVCLLLKSLVEINHNSVCELCVCVYAHHTRPYTHANRKEVLKSNCSQFAAEVYKKKKYTCERVALENAIAKSHTLNCPMATTEPVCW